MVFRMISFDVANAMTLHREAAKQAASERRSFIDAAITDFADAVGEVLKSIKEASASLTTTCTALKHAADDTFDRMTSASAASLELRGAWKRLGFCVSNLTSAAVGQVVRMMRVFGMSPFLIRASPIGSATVFPGNMLAAQA